MDMDRISLIDIILKFADCYYFWNPVSRYIRSPATRRWHTTLISVKVLQELCDDVVCHGFLAYSRDDFNSEEF
jgi:hypothetical protein